MSTQRETDGTRRVPGTLPKEGRIHALSARPNFHHVDNRLSRRVPAPNRSRTSPGGSVSTSCCRICCAPRVHSPTPHFEGDGTFIPVSEPVTPSARQHCIKRICGMPRNIVNYSRLRPLHADQPETTTTQRRTQEPTHETRMDKSRTKRDTSMRTVVPRLKIRITSWHSPLRTNGHYLHKIQSATSACVAHAMPLLA